MHFSEQMCVLSFRRFNGRGENIKKRVVKVYITKFYQKNTTVEIDKHKIDTKNPIASCNVESNIFK